MSKNKNILITGATSGIGEALALYYAEHSAKNLFICGRNFERLEAVSQKCEKLGAQVFASIVDITNQDDTSQWLHQCEKIAPLNLVIANAGVATLEETTANIYNTFNTNVNGVLHTVLPAIDIFKARDGDKTIAIVSSIAGYHGLPSCPSYSASKACVKAWGEGLRGSLKADNIKVSVICPGFVRSRITDKNTCAMPFFWEADHAAQVIAERLERNIGLIAFPWPIRFVTWLMSILPNRLSQLIYDHLPHKV